MGLDVEDLGTSAQYHESAKRVRARLPGALFAWPAGSLLLLGLVAHRDGRATSTATPRGATPGGATTAAGAAAAGGATATAGAAAASAAGDNAAATAAATAPRGAAAATAAAR